MAMLLSGCAYKTGAMIKDKYDTIYIAAVENKINFLDADRRSVYVPQLELLTQVAMIDQFMFDGSLRVVRQPEADLVLKAALLNFEREDLSLTKDEDVKEYRLRITMSLEMWDPINEKILWQEPSFAGEATYHTIGRKSKSETQAINDMLVDFSRRVVERTTENW